MPSCTVVKELVDIIDQIPNIADNWPILGFEYFFLYFDESETGIFFSI